MPSKPHEVAGGLALAALMALAGLGFWHEWRYRCRELDDAFDALERALALAVPR